MESLTLPVSHNTGVFEKTPNHTNLVDYSPSDAPWNTHRAQSDDVAMLYAGAVEFERYAARMGGCSGFLGFGWADDPETGESRLKLREAAFCRVRYCPTCQWRRTLMLLARFHESLPKLVESYPTARWVLLTLTVRNPEVTDLRATLGDMNKAWHRLIKRKEFAAVSGWIRSTEVTRGADGSAHPHFHCLLMVKPSWFGKSYIRQNRWAEVWGEVMRLDYTPNVDIRTVKAKAVDQGGQALLSGAVAEVLKYSVKPTDMVKDEAWFLELTRQTHKLRFVATGGALKEALRVEDESDSDLALTDGVATSEDDGSRLSFSWRPSRREYHRFPKGDKQANP